MRPGVDAAAQSTSWPAARSPASGAAVARGVASLRAPMRKDDFVALVKQCISDRSWTRGATSGKAPPLQGADRDGALIIAALLEKSAPRRPYRAVRGHDRTHVMRVRWRRTKSCHQPVRAVRAWVPCHNHRPRGAQHRVRTPRCSAHWSSSEPSSLRETRGRFTWSSAYLSDHSARSPRNGRPTKCASSATVGTSFSVATFCPGATLAMSLSRPLSTQTTLPMPPSPLRKSG